MVSLPTSDFCRGFFWLFLFLLRLKGWATLGMKESPEGSLSSPSCPENLGTRTWTPAHFVARPTRVLGPGVAPSPRRPDEPGGIFDISPHPVAEGAGSGRGTNTAGHMAAVLGNSGESEGLNAAGWWRGDNSGENSRAYKYHKCNLPWHHSLWDHSFPLLHSKWFIHLLIQQTPME